MRNNIFLIYIRAQFKALRHLLSATRRTAEAEDTIQSIVRQIYAT